MRKFIELLKRMFSFRESRNYIFLFGHMRCRSSVLSHIIGSNPDVSGYYELQLKYDTEDSLKRMVMKIQDDVGENKSSVYYFDKILHNSLSIDDAIINNERIKFLIMAREPLGSISSIIKMASITDVDWYSNPSLVLKYYSERLMYLAAIAKKIKGRYFFIDSDSLIESPDAILSEITDWLELKVKLTKGYKVFNNTGKAGFGDPSKNIKAGFLYKTETNSTSGIPESILSEGKFTYDYCVDILKKHSVNHVSEC